MSGCRFRHPADNTPPHSCCKRCLESERNYINKARKTRAEGRWSHHWLPMHHTTRRATFTMQSSPETPWRPEAQVLKELPGHSRVSRQRMTSKLHLGSNGCNEILQKMTINCQNWDKPKPQRTWIISSTTSIIAKPWIQKTKGPAVPPESKPSLVHPTASSLHQAKALLISERPKARLLCWWVQS